MIGKIVEIQGKEGLFVVVNMKVREDLGNCCYDRDYFVIPYKPELDLLEVNTDAAIKVEVKFVTKDLLIIREDKMPYSKYGESYIRGVKKIYLERNWESPKLPTR
jgi:hypothetical protein